MQWRRKVRRVSAAVTAVWCTTRGLGCGVPWLSLAPSSAVPSVLPWVLSCAPLEPLFCHHHVSFCVSPTAPCTAPTGVSPSAPPLASPQESNPMCLPRCLSSTCFPIYLFPWSPQVPHPDVSPVPHSCPSFLNIREPEHLRLPGPAAVWGAMGGLQWCQSQRGHQELLHPGHCAAPTYPNLPLGSDTWTFSIRSSFLFSFPSSLFQSSLSYFAAKIQDFLNGQFFSLSLLYVKYILFPPSRQVYCFYWLVN